MHTLKSNLDQILGDFCLDSFCLSILAEVSPINIYYFGEENKKEKRKIQLLKFREQSTVFKGHFPSVRENHCCCG